MPIQPVILAAGQGKRMSNPELPKVLTPLAGTPLIGHLLETIAAVPDALVPIIVVGYRREQVEAALGSDYAYAYQPQLLGTGHAVQCAREAAQAGGADTVLVLNGDHPLFAAATIGRLIAEHRHSGAVMSLATVTTDQPAFGNFGRILRSADGSVRAIRECKDASPEELAITEYNPALYCFDAAWLWPALERVGSENSQHEYYLTDLLAIAVDSGAPVASVAIERWQEALGVNTPEQLAEVEKWL